MGHLPIIIVDWIDSMSPLDMRWHEQEAATAFFKEENTRVHTVGQLFGEDESNLYIISSHADNTGMVDGLIKIPKAAVLSRSDDDLDKLRAALDRMARHADGAVLSVSTSAAGSTFVAVGITSVTEIFTTAHEAILAAFPEKAEEDPAQ